MEQGNQLTQLHEEQAYTARVQQLLLALIERAQVISSDHLQSIHAIVADAWEDLWCAASSPTAWPSARGACC